MKRDINQVQKGPGRITINRRGGSGQEDVISICIEDAVSGIILIEGLISLAAFANAVTGFASQKVELEYTRTQNFGLKCWTEPRSMVIPAEVKNGSYDYAKKQQQAYIREHGQEEGWTVSSYLGSQKSWSRNESGEDVAHYSVYKFLPVTEWEILNSAKQAAQEKPVAKKGSKRG